MKKNQRENNAMMIRKEIEAKNPNFCSNDISKDGFDHRYLYDKVQDILYVWYKQKREYAGLTRTIKPSEETFWELFSNHDEENLKEFTMKLIENTVSDLEKTDLLEFMCTILSDHEDDELKKIILGALKDKVSCMERSEIIGHIYREYETNLEYA